MKDTANIVCSMDEDEKELFGLNQETEYEENFTPDTLMLGGQPILHKLGAVSGNRESSPFVWKGRYMRLEVVCESGALDLNDPSIHALIRDVEAGEVVSRIAPRCYYHSCFVDGDTVYVLGTALNHPQVFCGDSIMLFSSKNLKNWEERELLHCPGFTMFNTSLTYDESRYVLAVECREPVELAGDHPFTCIFFTSEDLVEWTMLPAECAYPKDRYIGGPYLTYDAGYYYLFGVTELPCYRFNTYVTRTADLRHWEVGHYNPFIYVTPEDRMLSPYAADISTDLRQKIPVAFLSSLSDMDMCEYNGKTRLTYNVGNQMGFAYIAEAEYNGPKSEFLQSLFR